MRTLAPLLIALVLGAAHAQTYPTKPIRLVVPFAPGGSSSIVARSFAGEMEKGLGQSFVVENKGGGGGVMAQYGVIVVGGGKAALCAALAGREQCEKVLVLERAPEEESGGNSRFTAGLMRIVYNGAEDMQRLIADLSPEILAQTDFGTYSEEQFLDDMARVTEYRCDPDLTEVLVKRSLDTALWMRSKGVR